MTSGVEQDQDRDSQHPTPVTVRWLALLGFIPMLGVLLFAAAGAVGLRAFSHNNSPSCGFDSPGVGASTCSHYSYALPVTLGAIALLLVMGGGTFASYYAMRNVGLPLFAALRQRRTMR